MVILVLVMRINLGRIVYCINTIHESGWIMMMFRN
jgi:hypothetical protein